VSSERLEEAARLFDAQAEQHARRSRVKGELSYLVQRS